MTPTDPPPQRQDEPPAPTPVGWAEAARIREIDRRLYSVRLHRTGTKLIVLPGFVLLNALILPKIVSAAAIATPSFVGWGITVAGAAVTLVYYFRRSETEIGDLQEERSELVRVEFEREQRRLHDTT